MAIKFKNFWVSALSAAAAAGDTTLTIPTGDAANLPALTGGNTVRLVLPVTDANSNETDWEIVEVTAVNTTTGVLTVTRGLEGTTAKAWAQGARIDNRITADALNAIGAAATNFGGAAIENYTDKTASIAVTAATTTIDLAANTARLLRLAMGANTTLAFANVPTSGATFLTLVCKQDATGNRTLALPSGTKTPGGAALALSTAANAEDWIELVYDPALGNWRAWMAGKGMA